MGFAEGALGSNSGVMGMIRWRMRSQGAHATAWEREVPVTDARKELTKLGEEGNEADLDDLLAGVRMALICSKDDSAYAVDEVDGTFEVERPGLAAKLLDLVRALDREELTELALADSLCPLHLVDYAICFDDEDPACSAIRTVWPGHDT